MGDPAARRDLTHRVFAAVRHDSYEQVTSAIAHFEQRTRLAAHREGHLQGFLVGLTIGAIVGTVVTWLIAAFT